MSTTLSSPSGFSASNLVYNYNFSGTVVDPSYWNVFMTDAASQGAPWNDNGLGGSGVGGVNDADYFMPSQVSVNNGLTLTAAQSSVVGVNSINGHQSTQTFPVTSGVVDSYGKFEFEGGYLQISMKEPVGNGSWPGLWLLPGQGAGGVGTNYEIDIQEGGYTDGSVNPNDVLAYHLHTPSGTVGGLANTGVDLTAGFNTYGLDWVPGKSLTWYLNGKEIAEVTSAQAPIPDEPMELIMDEQVANSATNGWHTMLGSSTPQSMAMQVNDVQLYQPPGSGDTVTLPKGYTTGTPATSTTGSTTTTSPPTTTTSPPTTTTSPPTTITPTGAMLTSDTGTLVDATKNTWSLGAAVAGGGFKVLMNGVQKNGGIASEIIIENGVIWAKSPAGAWYENVGSTWAQTAGPGIAPASTTSATGTMLASDTGTLVDATKNIWSLGAAVAGGGFEVLMNGVQKNGGIASEIIIENGVIWAKSPAGAWYENVGSTWAQTAGLGIAPAPTTSATGTMLTSDTGTLVDATKNTWSLGAAVAGGGFEVLMNGAQKNVGAASEMTLENGVIWIKNPNSGTWYSNAGTYWATQTGGPGITVTPTSSAAETISFSPGATEATLTNASSFSGTVVGFAKGDGIDLPNFSFSNKPVITSVTGSGNVGTTTDVTVKDGSLSVTLALLNQHASQFGVTASAYSLFQDNNTPHHGTMFLAVSH